MVHLHARRDSETDELIAAIDELVVVAVPLISPGRSMALIRQWLPDDRGNPDLSHETNALDAVMLSVALCLFEPSISGQTPIDRAGRQGGKPDPVRREALAALRSSRWRLLQVEMANGVDRPALLRDVVSAECLTVPLGLASSVAAGLRLFARVVPLGGGAVLLVTAVTPLDDAAYKAARHHKDAGVSGVSANQRWAGSIFRHVARHGTLRIAGLNGHDAADAPDEDETLIDAMMALATEWVELEGAPADEGLLRRTRAQARPEAIGDMLAAKLLTGGASADVARGFERMSVEMLETVWRRERGGSATVTLDAVAAYLDDAVRTGRLPHGVEALFGELRRRVAGGAGSGAGGTQAGGADTGLEKLVARIQALRAKTVAQGCTEQEALAAAEKVAELLDRHGLSLGELEFRAQPCEGVGIETGRRRMGPIDHCVGALAAFFDCRCWLETGRDGTLRQVFFGLRGDVTAAQYLYEMVERAFETETAAFRAGPIYAAAERARRTASNSFQIGLAQGIANKLTSLREARAGMMRSASGRDLVPVKAAMVEDEMDKLGLALRSRSVSAKRRVIGAALAEGRAAGERFEVTPGLTRAA